MPDSNNNQQTNEAVSGSVEIRTDNGHVMSVFALSARDFERIKPNEDVNKEVAAMMAANKEYVDSFSRDPQYSNEERLLNLVQG